MNISASLWSANLLNLEAEIRRAEPHVDEFHLDVADGHYVPLLLFFPDMVAAIRNQTRLPLEVHLIVQNPSQWIDPFVEAGADIVVFYPDAGDNAEEVVRSIRQRGRRAGVSLPLGQSIEVIEPLLHELDRVVVMGTASGIKGITTPDPEAYDKIRQLALLRAERQLRFTIEADGAIRRLTVAPLRKAGADTVVPGSLIFTGDMQQASQWLRSI